MNQEDVSRQLAGLHECREPFAVVFSGRKSKKVNGQYNPKNSDIVIHNKNFVDDAGQQQESSLMYTAIHELAHHIQFTEYGQRGARCHTKLFKAILDELLEKAEEKGIYKVYVDVNVDDELETALIEAQLLTQEIARLQRELGAALKKLARACEKHGIRFDDVVNRKVHISMKTAGKAWKAAELKLPASISCDEQEIIANERDGGRREEMIAAAEAGKRVAKVKRAETLSAHGRGEKEFDNLLHEKERLEKQISMLQQRLRRIMMRLNDDAGLQTLRAAERRNE